VRRVKTKDKRKKTKDKRQKEKDKRLERPGERFFCSRFKLCPPKPSANTEAFCEGGVQGSKFKVQS